MKAIVMGCGRVGSQVSNVLAQQGHDVTVIDHRDTDAASRLGPDFKGRLISGLGFDRDILFDAGVEHADVFVAASSSDNANIVAARIARNIFKVPRVVARLYDPRRAEIYQRLGLLTISTTTWGAERIYELVTHADLDVVYNFGRGEVSIVAIEIPHILAGRAVRDLTVPGEFSVISITRDDKAFLPSSGTEFREGDILHIVIQSNALPRLEEMLGLEKEIIAMYVVIVGGGNTGSALARMLLDSGHTVRIIEERTNLLGSLMKEFPKEVIINGDGSSPSVLEKAGIRDAQVLAAITRDDETNLVVTSLARFEFNVPRTIARVNNPKNAWLFTSEMGVDVALNQADILAHLVAEEMSMGDMTTLLKLKRGEYSLVEEKVHPNSLAANKAIRDIHLPGECTIAAIIRNHQLIIPHGSTVLEPADEVLALVNGKQLAEFAALLASTQPAIRK